ncbi:MAG: hypothetical protein LBG96_10035 [Tannerella sp.]|nr:hypothetical protein [Tannerella sp.]
MKKNLLSTKTIILLTGFFNAGIWLPASALKAEEPKNASAYLLTYFKDDTHSLYFALSDDGYTFTDVNDGNPVIGGDTIALQKGIRDPHITRGPDGAFYLAMTDLHIYGKEAGYRSTKWERDEKYGWGNNRGFVLMKSFDLIHWTHSNVLVQDLFPDLDVACAWAPQTIYDPEEDKMMLYFTMRLGGNGKTKLYYAYTDNDFTTLLTRPQLLFNYPDSTVQVLDADITPLPDGRFCMMYVAQENPAGIKMAFSNKINSGYVYRPGHVDFEPRSCEAPNVWKRIGEDKWTLMYDIFSVNPHNFGFAETTDFETFTGLGHFDGGLMRRTNFSVQKHGAVIHLTKEEAGRLKEYYKNQTTFVQWAKTPPMGWNSWDCYGPTVEEHEVKANADYMAEHLKPYGWEYIVVDIRWFVENDKAGGYNQTDPRYVMDEYGRYLPAVNRFPSAAGNMGFKPLADYIHSRGLKFGIHIMRGIPGQAVEKKLPIKGTSYTADQIYSAELQCRWLQDNYTILDKPGAQEYYNSIIELYASWEVDFLKIDDLSIPYHKKEIEMIRKAIDRCGRPIVLSMSPGETPVNEAVHASTHANMWRMVNDVWDEWKDVTHLMRVAQDWYPYINPTWPDCDMIPLGRISIRGERGKERMTRLTRDEQYSLMTFFSIFRSPLMFGGDLPSNDEFTLSLLTNEDVLKMHRESTEVRQLFQENGKVAVTSRNPVSGEKYLAVFNISDNPAPTTIQVDLQSVGINGKCTVKNLWTGETTDISGETFSVNLRPHACGLYIFKEK